MAGPAEAFEPSVYERELAEAYQLDEAQLRWRRWCISANCGGDEEVFCAEYPASPEEAFLSGGRPVFNMRLLSSAIAAAKSGVYGSLTEQNGRVIFCPDEGRYLQIWQDPGIGREYVIGIDVAAGFRGGDYSAMLVLDKNTGCLAASWHGHIEPELLGDEAILLGRFYNRALLVPEANNHGIAVLGALRRGNYGHVIRRANGDSGFLTTARSKVELIAGLAAFLRQDAARITDPETLRECMSYVYDDKGHTNAQSGAHDDRVMALALAVSQLPDHSTSPMPEINWEDIYGADPRTGY